MMEIIIDQSPDVLEVEIQDVVYSLAAVQEGSYFAACSSGLLRSEDGGLTWGESYTSLVLNAPLPTTALAVSPDFGADQTLFAGVPGGILHSVDGGRNWYTTLLPSPPPVISTLAISPNFAQDGTLWAGTVEDGVFRSGNRGGLWSAWNFGLLDLNVLCLAISPNFAQDEILFAGTDSGIFRSTTGGRAWREVERSQQGLLKSGQPGFCSLDFAPILCLALSPHYAKDGVIFAGTESYGLFTSNDRGSTWLQLGEGVLTGAVNSILLSLEFPAVPDVLVLASDRLFISRDGGQSWTDWSDQAQSLSAESGITAVAAPQGIGPGSPLLVGLEGGQLLRI